MVASKCSKNHFISEKYETIHWFKPNPFKIAHSCIYTLLPGTVKLLETFAEGILWKPFQFFRRFLNDISRITKAPYFQCWFNWTKQVAISWSQVRRVWGCSSVVSLYFTKKSLTKTDLCPGALTWRRSQPCISISRDVSFWPHPLDDGGCQCTLPYSQ